MVKRPQSKLGYAVDGHVVRLPVRRPIIDDTKNDSKFWKSHVTKQKEHKKKKNARNHNPESGGTRGLRNKLLAFADILEDLRNYSKQGRIDDACTLVVTIACSYFGRNITDQAFQLMVRCLVAPGIENRSALYYAAHAGHVSMARTYLALLVLSRSTRAKVNDIEGSRTFASWMCEFGYFEFFGHREYNACILNALNQSTKNVFTDETYSLKDIQNIVMRSPWREYLHKIPHVVANIEGSRTFASWMCEFGYFEFFGHREYNACILNALNQSTKNVFTDETYSLKDIQNIVIRSPWREYLPKIPHAVAKKEVKPRLQVEGYFDLVVASPRLRSDHEMSYHLDQFSARGSSDEELSRHDFHSYDDYLDYVCHRNHILGYYDESHDHEGVESTTVVNDLEERMVLKLMLTDEDDKSDLAFPTIGDDPADQPWIDDWSEVHTTTSCVSHHDDVNCGDGDDWSIISEVASVKSINSAPFSYSDALRFGRKMTMDSSVENRLPSLRSFHGCAGEGESKGDNGDNEDACDAFFIREGIKDGRGGKASLRFKGNQKTMRWKSSWNVRLRIRKCDWY